MVSERILSKKLNVILPLILGISFFFLNLGISIFYFLSFFILVHYLFKNSINIDFLQKMFLIFLIYLVFVNFFKNPTEINLDFFLENFLLFKFFLLFLFIDIFIKDNNILKKIFIVNFFILIFLIFEVFLQRIIGFDLLGYSIHPYNRATGPYGEELVIGTLIIFVGFHSFFYFLLNYNFKIKILDFTYFILLFNLYFFSIYLTGERMNFLVSLMIIFIMILILIKQRLKLILSTIILFCLIFLTFFFNLNVSKKYETFEKLFQIKDKIIFSSTSKENAKENEPAYSNNSMTDYHVLDAHLLHFFVGFEIWKDNKVFGSGVKSFRKICGNYFYIKSFSQDKSCSTHPHNFVVELLSETGLVGLFMFIFFLLFIIKNNLKKLLMIFRNPKNHVFLISFFIIFISLIWPFKTTGRLFSNFYGTIFWFNIFTFYILLKRLK